MHILLLEEYVLSIDLHISFILLRFLKFQWVREVRLFFHINRNSELLLPFVRLYPLGSHLYHLHVPSVHLIGKGK
jgi:hypothetical protein